MEDEQVARRCGDEHLGTVGRQTHSHQIAGVEELFVRAAVLCEPAGGRGNGTGFGVWWETSRQFICSQTSPQYLHY